MKKFLRICFMLINLIAIARADPAPTESPITANAEGTTNAVIAGSSMPTLSSAPVSQQVASETSGVFQNTSKNLNLYVTQLQCQSATSDTSTCNSINNVSNPQNPSMIDNVNKFLFNSVSSELGVGVDIHF